MNERGLTADPTRIVVWFSSLVDNANTLSIANADLTERHVIGTANGAMAWRPIPPAEPH